MSSYYMKAFSAILLITTFVNSSNMRVLSFVARSSLLAPKASNHLTAMLHAAGTSETEPRPPPKIIQGGMGVRISSWQLAREVSKRDGLGVVSGTAMDVIFVRTLQDGEFLQVVYVIHKTVDEHNSCFQITSLLLLDKATKADTSGEL
jgi:hypothetical protein